jgi:chaperonin GroEL
LFSEELGNNIIEAELSDLGEARKVMVSRADTTIVGGAGSKEALKNRMSQIRDDIKNLDSEYDIERARERLAKLAGGVAVVRVGAPTEPEMKEKKDRVEDAMHATRAAVEEGIVPGGGVALLRCQSVLDKLLLKEDNITQGEIEGIKIIRKVLEAPLRRIIKNAGGKDDLIVNQILQEENPHFGYNAAKDRFEDLVDSGVIDPKKVVRCALQNAASVASLLLTTESMVADEPEDKSSNPPIPQM